MEQSQESEPQHDRAEEFRDWEHMRYGGSRRELEQIQEDPRRWGTNQRMEPDYARKDRDRERERERADFFEGKDPHRCDYG